MKRVILTLLVIGALAAPLASAGAHPSDASPDAQVQTLLASLSPEARGNTVFAFDDSERYDFGWIPGTRQGVRLDALDDRQQHLLEDFFRTVLSEAGAVKVDAIIATEAALGVIEDAQSYRDPGKYWTAVFGEPGPGPWGLRFEGHHLSVNLTFRGSELISATPLFLGANPETVPSGPDAGLRALGAEVDLAWALYESLDASQKERARGSEEWFAGFLTSPGERRAELGKPAGIPVTELDDAQQDRARALVAGYVSTVARPFAVEYLQRVFEEEWPHMRFYWKGAEAPGDSYYYRLAGRRVLIEHDNRSGGTHVHAIWRDAAADFGGL